MLQWFIQDIHEELPNLNTRAIYKIFCSMKGRNKKYWIFWLWKRDWAKFFISNRQMTYFIDIMIKYWFLEVSWEALSKGMFKCRLFKASKQLKEYFTQIKDVIVTKISNLSDRIKDWNNSQDITSYISTITTITTKYRIKKFEYMWIKYIIWKNKYKNKILNTDTNKWLSLFDFLLEIKNEKVFTLAYNLWIVW